MINKTLYISDLDGTLLNTDSRVSPYTCQTLKQLAERGLQFTYATARSLVSAREVTRGLELDMPVAVHNGTFVMEVKTGKILYSQAFHQKERERAIALLTEYDVPPLVYSFIDGRQRVSWDTRKENEGIRHYLSLKAGDKRMRPLPDESGLYDGEIFYFTCIGKQEDLRPLYEAVRADPAYGCVFQQELYRTEYWCEIMPGKATKANAAEFIRQRLGCDRVVAFGDALNDLPMFHYAQESYAVANAVDALKKQAIGVILSNDEDGVARWLTQRFQTENKDK